jgi:predicted secreted protein
MQGTAGYDAVITAGGDIIGKGQDSELTINKTPIDTTTRDSGGWKEWTHGLKEVDMSIAQLYIPTNAGLLTLRDAFLNDTLLAVTYVDANGFGWSGNIIVIGLGNPQPLDGAVMMPVTAKGDGAFAPLPVGS